MNRHPTAPLSGLLAWVFIACLLLPGESIAASNKYATVYGYGFDKWATAWLLTRHLEPEAELSVVERKAELPAEAIVFDVPGSAYVRTGERSAFGAVVSDKDVDDPLIRRLGKIVHRIEVAYWQTGDFEPAGDAERGFRRLQRAEGKVSPGCYLDFFDSLAAAIRASPAGSGLSGESLVRACSNSDAVQKAAPDSNARKVREIPLERVLKVMGEGRDVAFVDVREPEEFEEARIPGAINVPIRSLDGQTISELKGADLVVSYCVKDFRGYEMARRLARAGVSNSVILNPFGLKGWIGSGLPAAGREAMPEHEAVARLRRCIAASDCPEDLK